MLLTVPTPRWLGLESTRMTKYSSWPLWLQVLVIAPYGILLSAALWLWWPNTDKDRRKFGFVVAYVVSFYLRRFPGPCRLLHRTFRKFRDTTRRPQRETIVSAAPDMRTPFFKSGFAILLLATFFPVIQLASGSASSTTCKKKKLFTAQHIVAWSGQSAGGPFFYKSGLAIDADGDPRAYHPNDRLGLDSLPHAGHRGDWWALVTDNEKASGTPVVLGPADPAPGYFVSTTALDNRDNPNPRDPHRYVDAEKIPYVVFHPKALHYAQLGDFATVVNLRNGRAKSGLRKGSL
jgi:hypothetical protein